MVANVTVVRPPGGYRDWGREYAIEVDGREVGRLQRGSEVTVEVPSDREASVRAVIDWTGSPTWRGQLAQGEHARFEVAPKSAFTAPFDLFGTDGWIRIRRMD
jgi:hypothetical protein